LDAEYRAARPIEQSASGFDGEADVVLAQALRQVPVVQGGC
jgi:hypothetical protein